ncbi:hypothetical protein OAG84_03390 [Akkermansiaceae bacterium]|jgi:hypothetical protein|nr:hypothetical protein [Akkermansiaceae bacterium]
MSSVERDLTLPTCEAIRAARLSGFQDATEYLKPDVRAQLLRDYIKQDNRREKNLRRLIGRLGTNKGSDGSR